ncbi:FMN-binding protein [Terrisporobacter hibernicus]|uniref:FMN-binding protein n=1 Tax=Terrisporobacter hibernicus TaxID=2813371 RepID=A0AAX2ZF56_9FIRM|nr:FMN-binding protein [Terrisporobacter hibernicus]UEL47969.1 FMN-binding protein [Terrisporobacter hibernicus]
MKFKKTKIFLGVLLVIIVSGFFVMTRGIKEGKKLEINSVDISKLENGTYIGKYSKDRWISEVEVSVRGKKIENIKTLSQPLTPDVGDELSKRIIEKQNVNVDVISGATVSSKAYLKSVENALNK